jgi:hypothetical protein
MDPHDPSTRSITSPDSSPGALSRWLALFLILGLYLTLRGYHSRDNDQAYRLPLLLHRQDPALFRDDPFVRAFDSFNPHRGYLALLDAASRPLGLSVALFTLFVTTFALTSVGLDRLARAVWPEDELRARVGLVAIGLVLAAKAGNIATIHLFEAMLLDRLLGFALGWLALAWVIEQPAIHPGAAAIAIGLAALIHPSVGLQLALLLGASWVAWALAGRRTGVSVRQGLVAMALLGLAMVPWAILYLGGATTLYQGLSPEEFRLLCVELQNPQHMLPHLWRTPQWLAFGCYLVLALLATAQAPAPWPAARTRLMVVLAINLAGLGLAWFAIEVFQHLGMTVFQPFRMATVLRGLALVVVAGRVVSLWTAGRFIDRARVVLVAMGLAGDWMLVVATVVDLAVTGTEAVQGSDKNKAVSAGVFAITTALGLFFLARHDTESGLIPMLAALGALVVLSRWRWLQGRAPGWNRRRLGWALAATWSLPLAALAAAFAPDPKAPWAAVMTSRCRFTAVATDDTERLALWCRRHTPADARFIGPPGPKTFRLWSLRSVAFNRAASPYHAAGLADWAARFRDHVGFDGSSAELVRAYQRDRHGLESRYQAMSDAERAALARRQGAQYVIASSPADPEAAGRQGQGPLELLHSEGRYAVFRVRRIDPDTRIAAGTDEPR